MAISQPDTYTIHIEGKWSLEDLYVFLCAFEQVYFLVHSLMPEHDDAAPERIRHAYHAYPWQGGYSAVNFYNALMYVTPKRDRPHSASIHYGSPGRFEIDLIPGGAFGVERRGKNLANTGRHGPDTY